MQDIIQDYKAGLTLQEIAKKYYVSHTYIYHHIPKDLRRQKTMTAYHKDVIHDYLNGVPTKKIAARHSISERYIYTLLNKYDIKFRRKERE